MPRPGFNFLICPDPELIRQEIENLVAEHGEGKTWERRVHWADEELPDAFWSDLTVPDLMGTPRLVVVRRANKFVKEQWDKLTQPLGSFNASIWPVFCLENAPDKKGGPKPPAILKKTKFWPVADKRGWVWMSPGLTQRTMPEFVIAFARRNGLTVSRDTARALADALPLDAMGAKNELDKIALAAAESGEITREHLSVVAHRADMDVFAFISAVLEGRNSQQVWKKVFDNHQVPSNDSIFFGFLSLLTREARLLWELASGDAPSAYIPRRVMDHKSAMASRLGTERIARIWDLVMQAEMGLKTGQRTPEQAFEALVGGLHRALSPRRGAPRR